MHDLLEAIAFGLHPILSDAVHVPSLTFVMPHWLYWLGLLAFPFIAMYLVRREEAKSETANGVRQPIAWILWLGGGFAGLHRFYLRSGGIGGVLIALFVLVLYASTQAELSRNLVSEARDAVSIAEVDAQHWKRQVESGREGAAAQLAAAEEALANGKTQLIVARSNHDAWITFAGFAGILILLLLLLDAVRMPALVRRCREKEAARPPPPPTVTVIDRDSGLTGRRLLETPFNRIVNRINGFVGHFIAYWAVIAVAVYYYEVVARKLFNSPTNWAHESMFLMFGMQYLLSGGFALREDAHVRVDVIYERFSERTKAIIDLITSVFFFIFTVSLLVTGAIFALDSIRVWEVSFTEWAIQYWPVKCTIVIGALLIIMQGIGRVVQDVTYLRGQGR